MTRRAPYLAVAAALMLAGCVTQSDPPRTSPLPQPRAENPAANVASPASRGLSRYYRRVQNGLLAQGLLRTDAGLDDWPADPDELAESFVRIALFEEYATIGGRIVARETPSRLHRWEKPVRAEVIFGGAIPRDQKGQDRRAIENYLARLSRVTGHPVASVAKDANLHVFVVDEDARRALAPQIRALLPTIGPAALDAVTNLPRSSYCVVIAYDPEDDGTYERAVAIIRAEHPDLLRLSCIHEELAQAMGLSNDSPAARPSVFNDDEEYALLTRHDEALLRMLYDPRLQPGMTAAEARPIVRFLARERVGRSG